MRLNINDRITIFYTKRGMSSVPIVRNILEKTYNIKTAQVHELEILENTIMSRESSMMHLSY